MSCCSVRGQRRPIGEPVFRVALFLHDAAATHYMHRAWIWYSTDCNLLRPQCTPRYNMHFNSLEFNIMNESWRTRDSRQCVSCISIVALLGCLYRHKESPSHHLSGSAAEQRVACLRHRRTCAESMLEMFATIYMPWRDSRGCVHLQVLPKSVL
ncbi:uncharacterized protein K489DRAFT_61552 [Dissoconium aciculare CBS 342.82]|uniref:Uncharacterized protein n=1 Tax=Dissoconium aciculare CBS 342.82 TaxID=1314786 RepID=A0A6J3LZ39_9PEZI|nr:uncharacterized protein K489DRAFT_61552 [Dissoconium aciculare CBS 342.82]KAF1819902.1 hypothetical protein K489DRAFT_61552 [Dissoconium aciculare CBS 342.82]